MHLTGVIPPVITPLAQGGLLDRASFTRIVNRMLDAGVHGLFVNNSPGEATFSSNERRDEVTELAVELARDRVPVIVGVMDTQTTRMVDHGRRARALGAHAVAAPASSYGANTPDQVDNHYRVLSQRVDLPIYAYDLPASVQTVSGVNMLLKLGLDGVLQGVKDPGQDTRAFRSLILANQAAGSPLSLLARHEVVVDGALLGGADGIVPNISNVDPAGYVRMWHLARAGDWQGVKEQQDHLVKLTNITGLAQGVTGFGASANSFTTALTLLGLLDADAMPEAVGTLEGQNVNALSRMLRDVGLLEPGT